MAKKVLNRTHRDALESLAYRLCRETQDTTELDAAYDAAADMISNIVVAKYPKADMEVLKKYQLGRPDSCVYVSAGYGGYDQFRFRDDDLRIPYVPHRYCNERTPHLLTDEQAEVFSTWRNANEAHDVSLRQRQRDFRTLIENARTFEELVEIWPAADQLRERILGTSRVVSVMSEDVLARIKADPATTAAADA